MKAPTFFKYGKDVVPSRTVPFYNPTVVPAQMIPQLKQIGMDSVTGFYEFLTKNKTGLDMVEQVYGLYEDEAARLNERITRELERLRMIDVRCGPKTDPCASLPPSIIRPPQGLVELHGGNCPCHRKEK